MPRTSKSRRGGSRQGTPGTAYPNRTDLQSPKVASGQPYGERARQEAAQSAIPLPGPPPVRAAPPSPAPGSFGPLTRGTERPDEPLTAGLSIGAGAGPEAVRAPLALNGDDMLLAQLRGLYAAYPSSDLAALIDQAERRSRAGLR